MCLKLKNLSVRLILLLRKKKVRRSFKVVMITVQINSTIKDSKTVVNQSAKEKRTDAEIKSDLS